jgi:hypothetical protein
MQWALDAPDPILQRQILAFIEEHCRGLELHDVREWYAEAFALEPANDVNGS